MEKCLHCHLLRAFDEWLSANPRQTVDVVIRHIVQFCQDATDGQPGVQVIYLEASSADCTKH